MKSAIMDKLKGFLSNKKSSKKIKPSNKNNNTSSDFIEKKNQSLKDSQGVSDFSGSGYNGPGNVDREKTNSNMSQRNF